MVPIDMKHKSIVAFLVQNVLNVVTISKLLDSIATRKVITREHLNLETSQRTLLWEDCFNGGLISIV